MNKTKPYQPKTGVRCSCKRGVQRDNCPACEGTGWMIDFAAIRQLEHAQSHPNNTPEQVQAFQREIGGAQ